MRKKTQIFMVHGGMTFKRKKDYLHYLRTRKISVENKKIWAMGYFDKKLGKSFEIIRPRMPLQDNAKYSDWKIYFERFIPFLRDGIILIGGSLGGIFLAKYLSENKFPRKIRSVYLVCPPYDNSIPGEELSGGFKLKGNLSLIERNSSKVTLLFSKDDYIVPIAHAEKYRKKLPRAKIIIYKSKNGHFNISEFPELVKMIKAG